MKKTTTKIKFQGKRNLVSKSMLHAIKGGSGRIKIKKSTAQS